METCDFVVIGAGIAGASAAYALQQHGRTVLLEREPLPGQHTTGRSAAFLVESYGAPVVRTLTRASRPFFESPPEGFAAEGLLHSNPVLWIANNAQRASLAANLEEGRASGAPLEEIDLERAYSLCPVLRKDYVAAAVVEASAAHIDVAGLLDAFVSGFRRRGGELVSKAEVTRIRPQRASALGMGGTPSSWTIEAGGRTFSTGIVVNAAGAWSDEIGRLAGAQPIGLQPLRRTAITFAPPDGCDVRDWPNVIDADEAFYFKPEGAVLLASPCDETPSEPCDPRAEEIDIAMAADRVQRVSTFEIGHIQRAWAGLRSFVRDRGPVIGMDPDLPGFFWLAGQGGFGIMTSPAASRATAELAIGGKLPRDLEMLGLEPADLSPARLRVARDRNS
ncbi:MAG: FAD-dependent oxidoreductase [Deltaproteobacteria bacterium]|nr:FAD-dependent oxidoreductase [Deltaproteobacteria bacterium]